jgi:hypothetical protein
MIVYPIASRPRRATRARLVSEQIAFCLAVVFFCSLAPASIVYSTWSEARSQQAQWNIVGRPCPIVTRPSRIAIGPKPPMVFQYHGAVFSRSFGAVYCAAVPISALWPQQSYAVCQFNNPGAVTVSTSHGRVVFEAQPGQHTTISLRSGAVRCVMAGWFNL